jgi:quercetin dioxygenase-like cupin family protein
MRVNAEGIQSPDAGSALSVETITLAAGEPLEIDLPDADTILLVHSGVGPHPGDSAFLVLAGETERLEGSGRGVLRATIGSDVDRHAALGPREHVVPVAQASSDVATGKRSFEVLFGPHNGSTRATMFVGHVPPGAAPWHFHLYDEIVWIWGGQGRFHTREGSEPLGPGSAFRIRPREVHVVENTSPTDELVVVGLFTPAGSPSAAYLAADDDIPYSIGEVS